MPTALFFRYAVGGLVSLRTLQPTVHRCLASTKVRGHVLDLDAGIEHLLRFNNAFLFCGSLAGAALYLAAEAQQREPLATDTERGVLLARSLPRAVFGCSGF